MAGISDAVENVVTAALIGRRILLTPQISTADRALMALSALLFGIGIILTIIALERFLKTLYTPEAAAAISALVLFLLASLSAWLSRRHGAVKQSHSTEKIRNDFEMNIKEIFETVSQELDEPIRENPKTAVLIAALAGFASARSRYNIF